mgnify:CR=1 FL=1
MGDDGTPNFPNATLYLAAEELHYWENYQARDPRDVSLAGAQKHLFPMRERIVTVRDGEEFLPGVQAWLTPGHTPGHMAFLIAGNMCVTGDVAFHDPLSFRFPQAASAFDADRQLGIATRRSVLERLADERIGTIGYHAPWPGLGHVDRADGVFRYVAAG